MLVGALIAWAGAVPWLTALHPDANVASVQKVTGAPFTVAPNPTPYRR